MRRVPLGELATLESGGTPDRSNIAFYSGDLPWVTGADLTAGGDVRPRHFISSEALKASATRAVTQGTLLLVTRTSVGKVTIAPQRMAFSQDITAITPGPDVDARYLMQFLRLWAPRLNAQARGATIKGVKRDVVERVPVPLPEANEQRRIVAILDQADSIRNMRRDALALLRDQGRVIYDAMFGSTVATTTVLDIALKTRTGPFGSQLLHSEFVDEGIAVLGLDNVVGNTFAWAQPRFITPEKFDVLRRYQVESGDVLISIMGTTGRCVVVPDGIPTAINTKHICAITVDRKLVTPEFLRATFLWHPEARRYLRQQTKGSIMSGLNMGIVRAMPVPLPPLAQQQEFTQRLVAVEREVERMETNATEFDALFASLQSRAFRGEL